MGIPIVSVAAIYLVGTIVGLFNRLAAESGGETSIDDYGLSGARLLLTPALSGLAQWCPGWEARAVYARYGPLAADFLHRKGIPEGGSAIVRLVTIAVVALVVAVLRLGRLRLSGPSGD